MFSNVTTTLRRPTIVQAYCYTTICTALGDRFGTRFWVQNTGGNCLTLVARLEGGIALLLTDCENTLSPIAWHRDGRARGFYVGVYRTTLDAYGAEIDVPDQFASAYSETAEPTAEAIGDLICEALKNAAIILGSITADRFGSGSPIDVRQTTPVVAVVGQPVSGREEHRRELFWGYDLRQIA